MAVGCDLEAVGFNFKSVGWDLDGGGWLDKLSVIGWW